MYNSCMSSNCFRGDTHVYTDNGPTKIERIKIGNLVLTKDGTYKKVSKILKNTVKKPTLRIRSQNAIDTIYVTKEHKFYTLQKVPSIPMNDLLNELINKKIEPSFVEVEKLNTFDYIGYPIPSSDSDESYEDNYCIFSGIVYGNGSLEKDTYEVSFYRDKGYNSKQFLINYLLENEIKYEQLINKNFNIIKWKISEDKEESKPISKIYHLNKENTISFLKGCLESNGCSINENYKAMFYNTQNKRIGYTIRHLFMKLSILVDGFYKANHNHYVICIPYTQVLFDMFEYKGNINEDVTFFKYKDILWTSIKSIDEMKEFNGMVYNLEIEKDNNYVTEIGIVS
jgi:hypothetical protein